MLIIWEDTVVFCYSYIKEECLSFNWSYQLIHGLLRSSLLSAFTLHQAYYNTSLHVIMDLFSSY